MDISEIEGLSVREVAEKQRRFGFNVLPSRERKNFPKIVWGLITEPMVFLILTTVGVYFFMGDGNEAALLLFSVLVIISIEFYQEIKTEKSLSALRDLSSPIATVIRGGRTQTIPSRELVVGDIILLSEGSRIPADAKLISASNLQVNESLLTGESAPANKHTRKVTDYRVNSVFSGTLVVKGHGIAEVSGIGQSTELGSIGKSLKSIETEKTRLQKEVVKIVKIIAIMAVLASLILTIGYGLIRGSFIDGLLAGLTLSIAVLPEELPIVLMLFMALGAWRLAKNNALTRKAHTIEMLGSASVLCVDKTGTLTQNKMAVMATVDATGTIHEQASPEIVKYGVLASQINPFDPMEEAFIEAGKTTFGTVEKIYGKDQIIKEYPLDEKSLSIVHVWGQNGTPSKIALKGAPEKVFDLCQITGQRRLLLEAKIKELAHDGLRVLAVAKASPPKVLPEGREDLQFEFLGLIGLADPIRKKVPAAIEICKKAGIRVIMITGDYPDTAEHIGRKIGLSGEVITGDEFEKMPEAIRREAIKHIAIFSRVTPAHKLIIIRALKDDGEIVAMTGDGVNDAPALKAAHIGIAMGKRGTDVAREAATIILLDDDFSSIVKGIRLGRRIFDNLQKAFSYLLAVHIPIAALSLAPVFLGLPLILLPVHIVFLEFIIDPSSTLIFENEKESDGIMNRPPRKLKESIFSKKMLASSILQGTLVAAVIVLAYSIITGAGWSTNQARGITFIALALSNLLIIVSISGKRAFSGIFHRENKPMIIIISAAIALLTLIFCVPSLREIFKFEPLTLSEVAIGVSLGALPVATILPIKYLAKRLFLSK